MRYETEFRNACPQTDGSDLLNYSEFLENWIDELLNDPQSATTDVTSNDIDKQLKR